MCRKFDVKAKKSIQILQRRYVICHSADKQVSTRRVGCVSRVILDIYANRFNIKETNKTLTSNTSINLHLLQNVFLQTRSLS